MEAEDGYRTTTAGGILIPQAAIHLTAGNRSMVHGTTLIHPAIVRLAGQE